MNWKDIVLKFEGIHMSDHSMKIVIVGVTVEVTRVHLLGGLVFKDGIEIGIIWFHSWGGTAATELEPSREHEHLGMAWIRLI